MDALGCWPVERRQTGRQQKRADESDEKDNEPFDAALHQFILDYTQLRYSTPFQLSGSGDPWLPSGRFSSSMIAAAAPVFNVSAAG